MLVGWSPWFVFPRLQADTWGPQVGTQNRLLKAGCRQGILRGHQQVAVGKVRSSTPPGVGLRTLEIFPHPDAARKFAHCSDFLLGPC